MRRQNPPQSSLDQALALERWLNPAPLGVAYMVCATAGIVVITLLFVALASSSVLNPTGYATVLFGLVAVGIYTLALLQFQRRPYDLLSSSFRMLANSRREPLEVVAEPCAFKVLLRTGETLCVDLDFHYPSQNRAPEVREYMVSHVRTALDLDASTCNQPPTSSEVLDVVDQALEAVASEFGIPVLYSEVRRLYKIRDTYSGPDEVLVSAGHRGFATGTLG